MAVGGWRKVELTINAHFSLMYGKKSGKACYTSFSAERMRACSCVCEYVCVSMIISLHFASNACLGGDGNDTHAE